MRGVWKYILIGALVFIVAFIGALAVYSLGIGGYSWMMGNPGYYPMMGGWGYGPMMGGYGFFGWIIPLISLLIIVGVIALIVFGVRAVVTHPASSASQSAEAMPRNCPSCGKPVQASWNHCPYCGQNL